MFRADLEQYPRNPRSLVGLLKSLEAQNKISDEEWVRREFEAAWKSADVTLKLEDLWAIDADCARVTGKPEGTG